MSSINKFERELDIAFNKAIKSLSKINLHNEACLQHELAYQLRKYFDKKPVNERLNIEFERNIGTIINCNKSYYLKKEIDLFLSYKEYFKSAIEIKFILTKNARTPEAMFDFCKDISFLESLLNQGFSRNYFFAVVESNSNFLQGRVEDGIYKHFREDKILNGIIEKPTGSKKEEIEIKGTYSIEWKHINEKWSYIVIKIFQNKEQRNAHICRLKETGYSIPKIAKMYDLSNPGVFNILKKS